MLGVHIGPWCVFWINRTPVDCDWSWLDFAFFVNLWFQKNGRGPTTPAVRSGGCRNHVYSWLIDRLIDWIVSHTTPQSDAVIEFKCFEWLIEFITKISSISISTFVRVTPCRSTKSACATALALSTMTINKIFRKMIICEEVDHQDFFYFPSRASL